MSASRHSSPPAAAGRHPPAPDSLGQPPRASGTDCNIGFLLSVILTLIPFGLVMTDAFEDTATTALGVVQIIVHMVCFLQLNRRTEGSRVLPALIVTVLLVAILLVGTLWGMAPLDGNAVPGS